MSLFVFKLFLAFGLFAKGVLIIISSPLSAFDMILALRQEYNERIHKRQQKQNSK